MICSATLSSGKQCGRKAESDGRLCAFHRTVEAKRRARMFYTERLSEEDRDALAVAAYLEGVDAEIAVLRMLIRRVASAGEIEAARRGIDALCGILKAQHELDQHSSDRLAGSLERVLETMDRELVGSGAEDHQSGALL